MRNFIHFNWALLPSRIWLACALEFQILKTSGCGWPYLYEKWVSLVLNRRRIRFLGRDFFYEDRISPFLIFNYVNEVKKSLDLFALSDPRGQPRVLEIGGNVGAWGRSLLYWLPRAQLFTLEPNPAPFELLNLNSRGFSGWSSFNFGVGKSSGLVEFFFVPLKSGQGSIFRDHANRNLLSPGAIVKTHVELKKLDQEFCEASFAGSRFDLIKIDVEGAEWDVIEGIQNLDWSNLFVEVSPASDGRSVQAFVRRMIELWPESQLLHRVELEHGMNELYFKNKA